MTEPTIEWRDGLSEFLPPVKKAQAIIRDVIGQHEHEGFGLCSCGTLAADHHDHLTAEIIQALTKETP